MTKIIQHHANDTEACAKAMMYGWAERHSNALSSQCLLATIANVGLPLLE